MFALLALSMLMSIPLFGSARATVATAVIRSESIPVARGIINRIGIRFRLELGLCQARAAKLLELHGSPTE